MNDRWNAFCEKLDARTPRERLLATGVIAVVVLFAADTLFIEPARISLRQIETRLPTVRTELAAREAQREALLAQLAEDPDATTRRRLTTLRTEVDAVDAELRGAIERFVPPAEMTRILHALLDRDAASLTLLAVTSLPPRILPGTTAEGDEVREPQVHERRFELRFRGRYPDMLAYLQRLEALPWEIRWSVMAIDLPEAATEATDMDTRAHEADFTLLLRTLSLDKEWIGA